MIRTENGNTRIEGSVPEVMSDLLMVLRSTKESLVEGGISEERATELINIVIADSNKSEEEFRKQADAVSFMKSLLWR